LAVRGKAQVEPIRFCLILIRDLSPHMWAVTFESSAWWYRLKEIEEVFMRGSARVMLFNSAGTSDGQNAKTHNGAYQ
jgi:hypothetical protein